MPTNEQRRRAIQDANTAARRGSDGAAGRRAIGQAMVERRTGQSQADDLNALVKAPRPRKALRQVEPRGALPGQVGVGTYTPPANSGGGIASPLTEKTKAQGSTQVPDRDYWPATRFTTTDGLLMFSYQPTQTVRMLDADGNEVVENYARPPDALA